MNTKNLFFFCCFVIVCCGFISCSSNNQTGDSSSPTVTYDDARSDNYFPFDLMSIDGNLSVVVSVNDTSLVTYKQFFNQYGYTGNGHSWEGHIRQILEKQDPELLKRIEFDSEEGGFYAYMQNKQDQLKFASLLSPIFSDPEKLGACLKAADRSRIDD